MEKKAGGRKEERGEGRKEGGKEEGKKGGTIRGSSYSKLLLRSNALRV